MKKGKSIAVSLAALVGILAIVGPHTTNKIMELNKKEKQAKKYKSYYNMLNRWLIRKQEGRPLEQFFVDNKYCNVAIYGWGEMGIRLYDDLKESSIKVICAIDAVAVETCGEVPIMRVEDGLENVDAIIVSAIFDFDKIEKELKEVMNCPIISLEEIV